jgi:hypothetical protein
VHPRPAVVQADGRVPDDQDDQDDPAHSAADQAVALPRAAEVVLTAACSARLVAVTADALPPEAVREAQAEVPAGVPQPEVAPQAEAPAVALPLGAVVPPAGELAGAQQPAEVREAVAVLAVGQRVAQQRAALPPAV